MQKFYKFLVTFFSLLALSASGYGVFLATRSPLFIVKVVEVRDSLAKEGRERSDLIALADVPVGKVNLFDLDLRPIEARLLKDPWIRTVTIQKRFPGTVAIEVTLREPIALMQDARGLLQYVDQNGSIFGSLDLERELDLPIIQGMDHQPVVRLKEAVELIKIWTGNDINKLARLSSLTWDEERGFRAWVSYLLTPTGQTGRQLVKTSRSMLQIGWLTEEFRQKNINNIASVFKYLSVNSIPSRQILADAGKKVVVKIHRGS